MKKILFLAGFLALVFTSVPLFASDTEVKTEKKAELKKQNSEQSFYLTYLGTVSIPMPGNQVLYFDGYYDSSTSSYVSDVRLEVSGVSTPCWWWSGFITVNSAGITLDNVEIYSSNGWLYPPSGFYYY